MTFNDTNIKEMKKMMHPFLRNFLSNNECLVGYCWNALTQTHHDIFSSPLVPFRTGESPAISGMFIWEKTPEGRDFWKSVDRHWQEALKEREENDKKRKFRLEVSEALPEDFVEFLKEKGMYAEYLENIAEFNDTEEMKEARLENIREDNKKSLIIAMFHFFLTPEGSEWYDLNEEWQSLCQPKGPNEGSLFHAFLSQHGALEAYRKNLQKATMPEDNHSLIGRAFVWDLTPEGFDFWQDLSIKWMEVMTKADRILEEIPANLLISLSTKGVLGNFFNNTALFSRGEPRWIDGAEILSAFIWSETPEGNEFWSKIDDEWSEYAG